MVIRSDARFLDPHRSVPTLGIFFPRVQHLRGSAQSIAFTLVKNTVVIDEVLEASQHAKSVMVDHASSDEGQVDEGLTAWIQVIMGHLVFANTWGYITSFGVFQTYYSETLGHPQSDISWVGSIQMFLLLFTAAFSGRALDLGYFRPIFIIGSTLQATGVFLTSVSTEYWQIFLAQGFCAGLGHGLQYCPTIALVSTYFSKRRSLAIGLAAAGGATGGIIHPLVAQQLLRSVGFAWAVRAQGFIILTFSSICVALLKPKQRRGIQAKASYLDLTALKDATFTLYCIGMFLAFWATYFAFFYVSIPSTPTHSYLAFVDAIVQIGIYGREKINISQHTSITVLLVMNAVGIIGRIGPSYLADRYFGPLNMVIPSVIVCGLLMFVWRMVDSEKSLFAFAAIYGCFSSMIQSLFSAVVSSLTGDVTVAGQRLRISLSILSIACLTGPPFGGFLINAHSGDFLYAQAWGASAFILGGIVLISARLAKTGWRFRTRV